jgi:hypothetical protein
MALELALVGLVGLLRLQLRLLSVGLACLLV